jgi:hypothetical protein
MESRLGDIHPGCGSAEKFRETTKSKNDAALTCVTGTAQMT